MRTKVAGLLVSCATGALAFVVIMVADALLIGAISRATRSGLLGICGPYGSDTAIYSMLALLAAGPIAGIWAGIATGRRYFKRRSEALASGQVPQGAA